MNNDTPLVPDPGRPVTHHVGNESQITPEVTSITHKSVVNTVPPEAQLELPLEEK